MSATASNIITAGYAHEALDSFAQNINKIGRNLEILRKEPPARTIILRKDIGSVNCAVRQNLEVVFVQLNGTLAAVECDLCKRSLGPFVGCIQHPKVGNGSCANCLYRHQGAKCTHRVSVDTDSDDLPFIQSRKRQEPNVHPATSSKEIVKKRRTTIETETAGRIEATTKTATQPETPIALPAHHRQPLQSLLGPTPAASPPTITSQTRVGEPPIHGPGTALGSAADHWLKSLAFSKYASPAPTQGQETNNDHVPSPAHFENRNYRSSSGPLENNNYTLSQAPVAVRGNDYAPRPTPFRGTLNDNLDHDSSKPMLSYLPRNVSPEVLRSIAQYHQDLADDLRIEAKRLEKEMRQEREREREWGERTVRQAQYD